MVELSRIVFFLWSSCYTVRYMAWYKLYFSRST